MGNTRVRAILVNEQSEVVLIERIRAGMEPYWVAPGGGVGEEESQREALRRELMEEVGITASIGKVAFEQEFNGDREIFFVCYITKFEPERISAPEYNDPTRGEFRPDFVPQYAIADLNIQPPQLKDYLLNKVF